MIRGLSALMGSCLRGLAAPVQTIRRIPREIRISYVYLVPMTMAGGVLWGEVHYRFVNHMWLSRMPWPMSGYALLTCALGSLIGWLLSGMGLYALSRVVRRPCSFHWADAVACHFWFVWMASLLLDVVHLAGRVPTPLVASLWHGTIHLFLHAGWFFVFPMLFIQLLACWQVMAGRSCLSSVAGMLVALACIAVMRLGLEPLPEWIYAVSQTRGIRVDYWLITFHVAWILCLLSVLMRAVIADRHLRSRFAYETVSQ